MDYLGKGICWSPERPGNYFCGCLNSLLISPPYKMVCSHHKTGYSGAAPNLDDKTTLTLISMKPIHDNKLKLSCCHLVRLNPNIFSITHKLESQNYCWLPCNFLFLRFRVSYLGFFLLCHWISCWTVSCILAVSVLITWSPLIPCVSGTKYVFIPRTCLCL